MDEGDPDSNARLGEAAEFGCSGLVAGWANRMRDHRAVHASTVTRGDGPFYCAECYCDAIVRKCDEKRDHFAHEAPLTPAVGALESDLHRDCKDELLAALLDEQPHGNWAKERDLPEGRRGKLVLPRVRPDLSGRVGGRAVVIEVQASALSISKIVKRTVAHATWGSCMLWIVPLRGALDVRRLPLFRPRLYERYFHSMYFGRTYYWWPGLGANVLPVHYGPAVREIPVSEWYEEGGAYMTAGGYWKQYKVIRSPQPASTLSITRFRLHQRDPFVPENARKALPAGRLWFDGLERWWDEAPVAVEREPRESV